MATLSIVALTAKNKRAIIIASILTTIINIILFIISGTKDFSFAAVVSIILGLGVAWFLISVYIENNNMVKVKFSRLLPRHSKKFLLALGASLSIAFYYSYSKQDERGAKNLTQTILDKSLDPAINIITKNLKDKLIPGINQTEINTFKNPFNNINELEVNQIDFSHTDLENLLIQAEEALPEISIQDFNFQIRSQINKIIDPYYKFIPAILTLGVFLTVETVLSLLAFITGPMAYGVYNMLIKLDLIKEITKTKEIKRVSF